MHVLKTPFTQNNMNSNLWRFTANSNHHHQHHRAYAWLLKLVDCVDVPTTFTRSSLTLLSFTFVAFQSLTRRSTHIARLIDYARHARRSSNWSFQARIYSNAQRARITSRTTNTCIYTIYVYISIPLHVERQVACSMTCTRNLSRNCPSRTISPLWRHHQIRAEFSHHHLFVVRNLRILSIVREIFRSRQFQDNFAASIMYRVVWIRILCVSGTS